MPFSGWTANSGFVAINATYNNNDGKSVLLISSLFLPSIVHLHVAAILIVVHTEATDG